MAITKTTSTGFLGNLFNSILAVPIGILIFLASFVVLFLNEGRTNIGKLVDKKAAVVAADDASNSSGDLVSITGTLVTDARLEDPEYLGAGNYVRLERVAEQYVWVENTETETRDKVGGGTETTTTYTYEQRWTSSPPNSEGFEDSTKRNPPQTVFGESWLAQTGAIGAWTMTFSAFTDGAGNCLIGCRGLPSTSTLDLSRSDLVFRGPAQTAERAGSYIYLDGSSTNPTLGDHRISFRVLEPGGTVTAFGAANGGTLLPYNFKGDSTLLRMVGGDREAAISTLKFEHAASTWIIRFIGFMMMWMGMGMVFAPLHAIAGILPFLKKGTKAIVGFITFPIALVLTTITVVVSAIAHSWVAMLIVFILVGGGAFWLWKNRQSDAAVPPGGMGAAPPMGPPPGPPPGGPGVPPGPAPGAPPGPPPAA